VPRSAGGIEQFGQVVDRAGQPPAPAARDRIVHAPFAQLIGPGLRPPQRPLGVDQQPLGLVDGGGGQLGQLPGDPPHRGRRLLTTDRRAGAQPGGDLMRAFPRRTGAVAQLGADRTTCGPDPFAGRGIRRTALASRPESVG